MARPLRIEFPGAIHHVMARGNARQAIFLNDEDRDAYESGHRQLPQTGAHFGLHYSTCVKAQDLTPTLLRDLRQGARSDPDLVASRTGCDSLHRPRRRGDRDALEAPERE